MDVILSYYIRFSRFTITLSQWRNAFFQETMCSMVCNSIGNIEIEVTTYLCVGIDEGVPCAPCWEYYTMVKFDKQMQWLLSFNILVKYQRALLLLLLFHSARPKIMRDTSHFV